MALLTTAKVVGKVVKTAVKVTAKVAKAAAKGVGKVAKGVGKAKKGIGKCVSKAKEIADKRPKPMNEKMPNGQSKGEGVSDAINRGQQAVANSSLSPEKAMELTKSAGGNNAPIR